MSLEEQVAEIVTDAVEQILRLVGRDDISVPSSESIAEEVPVVSRPAPAPRGGGPKIGSGDPILDNFLGVNR